MKTKKVQTLLLLLIMVVAVTTTAVADGHILVFHRFADQRYPSTNISKQELTEVFDYLEENKYQVVPLEKLVSYIKKGKEIPDKMVALTIDDGYRSFYKHGLPIFKEYNYPFTIFVNTKAINEGYNDFLTWEQVQEIAQEGTIASHGYAHPHLTTLDEEGVKCDIQKSISDLEKNVDQDINFFSYPYGEYNQQVKEIAVNSGFEAVFNQDLGAVAKESDIYDLNRIAISDADELPNKLNYDFLPVEWASRDEMVTGERLTKVKAKVNPKIEKAQLYLSGHGWREVELKNGLLNLDLNLELKNKRNRIFLKTYDNKLSSKLIMRESN